MVRGLCHVMEVNERYDVFAAPSVNAFRPAFQASLERRISKPGEKD
ncbi:hypothetical protein ACFP51_07475 [Streptomyces pratens]|uniref:Uncharacterized protein n=1 Tax=Streptomyces pratens TaxID=887456 RepID=A0ABW1M6B7_9ACTN